MVKTISPWYSLTGSGPHFYFLPWVTNVHAAQTVWDIVFPNVPKLNF